jgi:hypothetical protein
MYRVRARIRDDHAGWMLRAGSPPREERCRQVTVARPADAVGVVTFGGTTYPAGRRRARTPIGVAIAAASTLQPAHENEGISMLPFRRKYSGIRLGEGR